jgi:hypothetical protein
MRLYVSVIVCATEVVLLLKLGKNEVCVIMSKRCVAQRIDSQHLTLRVADATI